jgi:hypothetical protein
MTSTLRPFVAIALVAIAIVRPGVADVIPGWQSFQPADDSFAVEMPVAPTIQSKERGFPPFDFVSTVYTARVGNDAFGLNHTDLPRVALYFKSESSIFESARSGFLEDSNASEVSFEKISFVGGQARELIYDIPARDATPALRGTARMFFEKNRLYIVWAEVTSAVSTEDLERYFGSLRIGTRQEDPERGAGRGSRGSP